MSKDSDYELRMLKFKDF